MSDLKNKIRIDFENLNETDFPLEILPTEIQTLIIDLHQYRGFPIEYTAASLLSATATAIGNNFLLNFKDGWTSKSVFYFLLVGEPGSCKTHPLNFAFNPLQQLDINEYEKFKDELKIYLENIDSKKASKNDELAKLSEPICKRCILSDATPEVIMRIHNNNRKGIVLKIDEFAALIKSVNQYSKGHFLQTLLSTWSNSPLTIDRCNNPIPIIIDNPHVNIIGTIQPKILNSIITKELEDNGFSDRLLYVLPKVQTFNAWNLNDPEKDIYGYISPEKRWTNILDKIINFQSDNEHPQMVYFSKEAKENIHFWQNSKLSEILSDKSRIAEMGRFQKTTDYAIRFCLVLQIIRWACNESNYKTIDTTSVEAAIKLIEWLDNSYTQVILGVQKEKSVTSEQVTNILKNLPDGVFKTSEAYEIAKKFGLKERATDNFLKKQVSLNKLKWVKQGFYKKIK